MYSIVEIAFFILYFVGQAIKISAILLIVQISVFRLTGFSPYKFINRKLNKLLREEF